MSVKTLVEPEKANQILVRRSWDGVERAKALASEKLGFSPSSAV